jgi:hypothetical protein
MGTCSADGRTRSLAQKVQLPARPGRFADLIGSDTLILRRRFHRPTHLDSSQRVCLKISNCPAEAELSINGVMIPSDVGIAANHRGDRVFDIGNRLSDHNELVIAVKGYGRWNPAATILGGALLEISEPVVGRPLPSEGPE